MKLSLCDLSVDALSHIAAMLPLCDSAGSLTATCRLLWHVVSTAMLTVSHLTACPNQKFWQNYRHRIENITLRDARRLPPLASPLLQSLKVAACDPNRLLFADTHLPVALKCLEVPAIHHEEDAKAIPWERLEQLALTDCKSMGVATLHRVGACAARPSLKRIRCGRPTSPTLSAICQTSRPLVTSLKIDRVFDVSSPTVWIGIQFGFPELSELTFEGCLISDCHVIGAAWQDSLRVLRITDTTLGDRTLRTFVSRLRKVTHMTLTKSRFTCDAIRALILDTSLCPLLQELVVDSRVSAALSPDFRIVGGIRPRLQIQFVG